MPSVPWLLQRNRADVASASAHLSPLGLVAKLRVGSFRWAQSSIVPSLWGKINTSCYWFDDC